MNIDARLERLESKLDANHRDLCSMLSALTATVSVQAVEHARHDAACTTDRGDLSERVGECEVRLEATRSQLHKLWVKVAAIVAAVAAGGAGAAELLKAWVGG